MVDAKSVDNGCDLQTLLMAVWQLNLRGKVRITRGAEQGRGVPYIKLAHLSHYQIAAAFRIRITLVVERELRKPTGKLKCESWNLEVIATGRSANLRFSALWSRFRRTAAFRKFRTQSERPEW